MFSLLSLFRKHSSPVLTSDDDNQVKDKTPAAWVEFLGAGHNEPITCDFDTVDEGRSMFADIIAQNPANHFHDEKGIYSLSFWDNEKKEVAQQKFCDKYPPELGKIFYKWRRK